MEQVTHKHHIVPRYRCKELGIDPDFDDNIVEVTRFQHANIHWGYWCKDLSALLEVCSPPQYVIDMIPLGDKRDIPAVQILAEGEIDGVDMSGENNPMYGKKHSPEALKKMSERTGENNSNWKGGISLDKKAWMKEYRQTPKRKEYEKEYQQRPERKEYMKEYYQKPEYKEARKGYEKKRVRPPEYWTWKKKYNAERYARKKAERQGVGTLDQFMG